MHVRVLGPLEIGGSELLLGVARKTRQVVVMLALAAPASLSVDRLVDALWDDPPESAIKTVQSHVSLARRALATAGMSNPILGGPAGYALDVGPDELDVLRDARLRHDARAQRDRTRR